MVSIDLKVNELHKSSNVVIKSKEELKGLFDASFSKVSFLGINGTIWNYKRIFDNIQDETSTFNGDKILISFENGKILIQRLRDIVYRENGTYKVVYSNLVVFDCEYMKSLVDEFKSQTDGTKTNTGLIRQLKQ